jgi:hypothetical protein
MDNTYEFVFVLHLSNMSILPLRRVGSNDGPVLQEQLTRGNPTALNVAYMLFDPGF